MTPLDPRVRNAHFLVIANTMVVRKRKVRLGFRALAAPGPPLRFAALAAGKTTGVSQSRSERRPPDEVVRNGASSGNAVQAILAGPFRRPTPRDGPDRAAWRR